jgi:hypothetical protein
MSTTNIVLMVLAGVFLVLYLMRRRSRLGREDD